jgi:beta-glucosidase
MADPWSDEPIENVASKCDDTQVVIHNAGIRVVDRSIDHPNVTAVILAHLPGQETGQALVDIIYGKQSPSGRLPYTVAKRESDYGNILSPVLPDASSSYYTRDNFAEGVYIDYKYFIARNITPRFAFGFGLTYSEFSCSKLATALTPGTRVSGHGATYNGKDNNVQPEGYDPALWVIATSVACTIKNTGSAAAAEVAQLYVRISGSPVRQLRGFEKKLPKPGEEVGATFELTRRDLSIWNVQKQDWTLQADECGILVGKSVLDIQLRAGLKIERSFKCSVKDEKNTGHHDIDHYV